MRVVLPVATAAQDTTTTQFSHELLCMGLSLRLHYVVNILSRVQLLARKEVRYLKALFSLTIPASDARRVFRECSLQASLRFQVLRHDLFVFDVSDYTCVRFCLLGWHPRVYLLGG